MKLPFLILNIVLVFSMAAIPASTAAAKENSQAEELFIIAQKAFDDGFYDVAIRYIEQFLQKFPSSKQYAQARLLLGECYFFKNQYLNAFEIFQSLLNTPGLEDATHYWMGETYFKGSDYKNAKKYYQKVISQFPESTYVPQSYYSLAWTFFEQGDYEQAKINFEKLLTQFSDHVLVEDTIFKTGETQLNLSNYKQAIEYFETYIDRYPKSQRIANALYYLAESYYYREDLLKANTFYAKAAELTVDPRTSFISTLNMGWIYIKLKKFDLAESFLEKADAIAKKYGISQEEILLGKGAFYTETKDYQSALDSYNKFLTGYPNNVRTPDALLGKANAYYLLGQYDDAILAYRQLLDQKPSDSLPEEIAEKSYYGIAWSYLKIGQLQEAIQTFEIILERAASDTVKSSALSQIGDAYQDAKQLSNALLSYDRILNEYPQSLYADYAQFQQGVTLLKMGKLEPAKLSFQSLKTNFPTSKYIAESYYYLGFAHFQNDEWRDAISHIQSFLTSSNANNSFIPQANYILALSYFNQEHFKQALELFQKIRKDVPDQPSIQQTAEYFIGRTLHSLGKTSEAIKQFTKIGELYPLTESHQDALLWLGEYYLQEMNFKKAVYYFDVFIETFPTSERINLALYELGQSYQALKKFDRALDVFNQVQPTASQEIYAKAQLAIAEIFSEETGAQKALETYHTIAQKIPDYKRDALQKIGKIHQQEDRPHKAIAAYTEALNAPKAKSLINNAELIFSIADNYELLNNPDKAVEEYLKIPYLFSNETNWSVKAYLRVARIMENKEDWEEAKIIYQKIMDLDVDETKYAHERLNWINEHVK